MKTPIAILPKLCKPKSTAKRQEWFVCFSYINPATGRMERFRIWEGFAACSSIKDKERHGYNLVRSYTRKLKAGWNPFANDDILFSEDLPGEKVKTSKITTEAYLWTSYEEIKVGISYGTYKNYRQFTERFIKWMVSNNLEGIDIYYITTDHATAFLNYLTNTLKLANKYRNEHHSYLKKAFTCLVKKNIITVNPFDGCKKLKKAHRPGVYYKEGIKNIIKPQMERNDPALWLFVNFIYYTCIRPKELRALTIKDINVFDGVIRVPGDISKNGKTQTVVIPFQLYEKLLLMKLNEYPDNYYLFGAAGVPGEKKIGINFFNKRFRKLRDKLGIPSEYKLYNWKHTANVNAIREGHNLKEMQMHNRHGDLNTFDIYIRGMVPEESENIRYKYPTL